MHPESQKPWFQTSLKANQLVQSGLICRGALKSYNSLLNSEAELRDCVKEQYKINKGFFKLLTMQRYSSGATEYKYRP